MIKFQIIIDKKGAKKTIKPFLGRTVSSLALIFSVVVLSTIIGLGIHLVLAYTNPTADPPGDNVEGPINVGDVTQTKVGKLEILEGYQKDDAWGLTESGSISGTGLYAVNGPVLGKDVLATEKMWANELLQVDGEIYAPTQNREHEQLSPDYSTPNTEVITCPAGKFLYKVQVHKNGVNSQGWCAAPFRKYDAPVGGGGGGDIDDAGGRFLESSPGSFESFFDQDWWWIPGAF